MRKLAWLLGFIAVVGTCVLGINYYIVRKHAKVAEVEAAKYAQQAADWDTDYNLREQNDESALDLAYKRLQNADLEEEIAEYKGGMGQARAKEAKAEDEIEAAKMVLSADREMDALGGSYEAGIARERELACTNSMQVYRGSMTRDQHLTYALGVVWLAFGFAIALAQKH